MAHDKDRYTGRWRCGWTLSESTRKAFFSAYGKVRVAQSDAVSISEFAEQLIGIGLEELKRQQKGV